MTGLHPIQNYLLLDIKSDKNLTVVLIIFGAIRFIIGKRKYLQKLYSFLPKWCNLL